MKKIIALSMLAICLFSSQINAQVKFSLNINIGDQPAWGPTGYDRANYYYLPDVDAYYDVPNKVFIYQENNRWVNRTSLPARYRNYDLYSGYKVVVNEPKPYLKANYYRTTYGKYKNGRGPKQTIIRDSRDDKYKNNRERWERDHRNDRKDDRKDDRRDNHRPGRG